ncbi:MAG: ABC transporter permease [Chloroflexi bacterium]|nr:ABC transporter permease [Chloroflexota bacterium]
MTVTLIEITLRGLLNRRRTLLLVLLGVLVVLVAGLYRLADQPQAEAAGFTGALLGNFGLGVLVPLVAVIVGTAALGSELEEGTIVYLLARPVPRWRIVLAKLSVSWLVVTVLVAVPILVAGIVAHPGDPGVALAYAGSSVVAALEYTAVFMALSLVTSRALIVGLAYVVIWEGVVASLFAGTRIFSIRQHALAVAEWLDGGAVTAELAPGVALVMAGIVTVGATLLAVHRLERVELRGETA